MDLKEDVMMIDGLGEGRDGNSWMRADRDQAQVREQTPSLSGGVVYRVTLLIRNRPP